MRIIWWSDYACPYCYIAEARLHKAIKDLGMEGGVEFEPHAFELDPSASKTVQSDTLTRFAAKYHLPLAEARAQIEYISQQGREAGLDFRYATTQYTNTFDAHRLMKLALSTGDQERAMTVNRLIFAAYFTKNLKLAEHSVLMEIGQEAGLDKDAVRKMLDSNEFGREVREDEEVAARAGIRGVPYFIFPDGAVVPGAVSEQDFKELLLRSGKGTDQARQCGVNGCQI